MNTDRKMIGICLSQAHTFLKTDLISELDRAARADGYGILVFNSSLDYYQSQRGKNVTRCVYDLIRFDKLAALVILHDNIYDMAMLEQMIRRGSEERIPVFYVGGVHENCFSIVDDYTDAYKQIIRHVIRDHGVTDPFFIAGLPNEDNSKLRLKCFREVLSECGLPCPEENIAYGNYLEPVAAEIVRNLIAARPKLPRAFICANDSMAAAVCDELKSRGIRVPDDVIVTGFDGTPTASLVHPQLTTCHSNPDTLADQVISLLRDIEAGKTPPAVSRHPYRPVIAESCGCPGHPIPRFTVLHTFRQAETLANHENTMYYAVEQLLEMTDVHDVLHALSALLLPDSVLYVNRSLLESDPDAEYSMKQLEDELIMIPYRAPNKDLVFRKVYRKDMPVPDEKPLGSTIVSIVHSSSLVCGYYAAHSDDLAVDIQLIKRLSDVLNLIFSIQIGRIRQRQLRAHLESNLYMDSATSLENLKGLTRWFESYSAERENHERPLAVSVYGISRYSYIYETYGMADTEEIVRLTSVSLREANPGALAVARISEDQFAVAYSADGPEALGSLIDQSTGKFYRRIEQYNASSTKPYFLEVNCGCTTVEGGWDKATLENLIRLAIGEMYLNRMKENGRNEIHKAENPSRMYSAFSLLIEKNLFRYHFQPIVDAKTGLIWAYEALMRTDGLINMSPLEILATAREYGRLYEVEKVTLSGIMERYVRNYGDFQGCKVFINTIPGYFLNEEDCSALQDKYGSYLDCFVFELTEDASATDSELERMKKLCKPGGQARIAIDDYGTGHSNIINLLRYSPNIIKIDRALISGISQDSNRRLFVQNTIDFAHQNGIRALAEGVETSDELRTVISCGVDLIQGFYTGRPTEQPLRMISEKIRNEILEENLRAARYDSQAILHVMKDGETANLFDLALRKVTCLQVGSGTFTIEGIKSQNITMSLRIDDGAEAIVTLRQVNMKGVPEPAVRLGRNSRLTLLLEGQNTLTKEGIHVPASASLTIAGNGQLHIHNNRNYSVGIGANYNDPYGSITLDTTGLVNIHSSGDKVVCLGGGRSAGHGIRILRGTYNLSASGINVIGVGSSVGLAEIDVGEAALNVHGEGNEVMLIGSVTGESKVRLAGDVRISSACERATGLGTLTGTADVLLDGGSLTASVNCDTGAIIGTFDGEAVVRCRNTRITLHGEGNRVAGFGSLTGACDTRVESGSIRGELLAGERLMLGNENSRFIVTGGNFHAFSDTASGPVSPAGDPLHFENPKEDHFEQTFRDRRETWTYIADRDPEGHLGVYIPAG